MKKKIKIFVKYLKIGGVEKQLVYLANGLDKNRYDVSFILCSKEGDFLKDNLKHVKIRDLMTTYSGKNTIAIALKLFFNLLKDKPDIFISSHGHLHFISVFVCKLLSVKLFCQFPGYFYRGKLNFLRKMYLTKADKLIAVSEGVRKSLVRSLNNVKKEKITVIKNTVDYENILRMSNEKLSDKDFPNNLPIVISIGRLDKLKRFDLLIKAAPLIKSNCNIVIIGDGPDRINLETLCKESKAKDKIYLLGMKTNPYKYLKLAKIFVLTSESEGLPTVILESKALGVPCICSDYLGGTKGVVNHNVDGYVYKAENVEELSCAIDLLLNDEKLRENFIFESNKQIRESFNIESYIKQYEKLFNQTRND